jgi:HEAT repeat protein
VKARRDDSPLPSWFIADLLGLDDDKHRTFGQQIIDALDKIDPDLTPKVLHHPLANEITKGVAAYSKLLGRFAKGTTDEERALALDAIAEIATRAYATKEVIEALQKILGEAKSDLIASVAARALASTRDENFLEHQHNVLLTKSPRELRIAARLLGYGRYQKAAPSLLEVLTPDNAIAADAIIWALGEIGHDAAVAKLHTLLTQFAMTEEVLIALGKIASRASVVRLTPMLLEGMTKQRELAAEALAKIARRHKGSFGDPGLDKTMRAVFEKVIDSDDSRIARFHAIVAYSLIGGHLEPKRILAALGGKLSNKEIGAVGAMLTAKKDPPKGGKPKAKGKRGV